MHRVLLSYFMISLVALMSTVGAPPSNALDENQNAQSDSVTRLQGSDTLFDPNRTRLIYFRNNEVLIALTREKKSLAVNIETTSGFKGLVELPPEIAQVNEIRGSRKDQAIVIGMVNGSAFEAVILNTRTGSITDRFFAYSPTVSPDGQFVAFVKFYPSHFVQGTDDHYVLYDSFRSPIENRSNNVSVNDYTNVGLPVYPRGVNRDGDNTGVPEQNQHHMMAQRFFWQSDSKRYAFADEQGGQLKVLVVSVGSTIKTRTCVIQRGDICRPLRKQTCQVTLADTYVMPVSVLVAFRGVGVDSALEQSIELSEQQFSSVQ